MAKQVLIPIVNCKKCPHCYTKLTKGFGFVTDFMCRLTDKCIKGYCEWKSDEPQDGEIPDFCPFVPTEQKSFVGENI